MCLQDNWLFKRSGRGEVGKEGVTMLVPNPCEVAKAQIGNRDFDLVRLDGFEDMFRAPNFCSSGQ